MSRLFNDLFIFEIANSHQGDVEHGKDIIHEMGKIARKYNINAAVKLQYRNLDNFIHPDYVNRTDVPHVPRFMSTRLTYDQFTELVDAIKEEEMIAISTPFDEGSVDWCMEQGIDIIKISFIISFHTENVILHFYIVLLNIRHRQTICSLILLTA